MHTHALSLSKETLKDRFKHISICLSVIVFSVLCILLEYCTPTLYQHLFHDVYSGRTYANLVFLILTTCVCFFILPSLLQGYVFKQPLQALGLRWPTYPFKTLGWMIVALSVLLPWIILCAHLPSFQYVYALTSMPISQFIIFQLFFFPLYYFLEEFFFRGFLFLTLYQRLGWHSFWITEILFTLAHVGKPPFEILLSIPASVVLSYLTLKTRSFYPAVIVHWILGVSLCLSTTFF